MKRCAAFIAIMAMMALPAIASPLIADLSQHEVNIDSRFNGTELLLFGAQQEPGDIVVVMRGPAQQVTMRKKERVAGIWVNRHQVTFHDIPHAYHIAATRPLDQIIAPGHSEILKLGLPNLLPQHEDSHGFRDAFLQERMKKELYQFDWQSITFMGQTLFKAVIPFSKSIARGDYTAEIYLFNNGALVGMQVTPLRVRKQGLDAFIFDLAHHASALYGLLAIALALVLGWLASVLSSKR